MRNRSRTDLFYDILEAARGEGISKTKIMYKAFLSYTQLVEYTSTLEAKGLLKYDQSAQVYRITSKGLKFIDIYVRMNSFIPTHII
jgi:predicted transcriptional regulator